MKKLLTVLCVAAFGFGAVAQAQVVPANGAKRMEAKEGNAKMSVMSDYSLVPANGQLNMDEAVPMAAAVRYDTLHWHDEYVTENCDMYYTITEYYEDLFAEDVVPSPFGASWSGTGEVGTTFQTEDNLYETYARIDVNSAWVVGAIAYVYRRGNTAGWERVGIDRFDPDHMSEVNGVIVPDMPCRIIGYPGDKMSEQPAYSDYYGMLFKGADEEEILMEMPITMKNRAQTPTTYVRYLEPVDNQGMAWPGVHRIGGMFDQVFPAWGNFGLSIQAEYTNNAKYDSLWNWAVTSKSNKYCGFIDEWAAWERLSCYNVDSGWIWLTLKSGDPFDVSLPWNSEDSTAYGLAPDDCPQIIEENDHSLYIYAFSMNMSLSEGYHVLPMIYPIIQNTASIERGEDAYAQTVSVYPVPATDKVNVVALDPIQKVEVYNMAGTLVKVIMMNDNRLELDVTSFVPGTYVAKITTEKGVASKKLLVK